LVEKVFQKRSKSPIFAVARTIVSSSIETCVPSTLRHLITRDGEQKPSVSGRVRSGALEDSIAGALGGHSRTLAQTSVAGKVYVI
jgi:hypothetical protein